MRNAIFLSSVTGLSRFQRTLAWTGVGVIGVMLGATLLVRQAVERERDDFETAARIAHRLLSQRAVQHEAVLATLGLIQPAPDVRLPAIYPQILQVQRRAEGEAWSGPPALRAALRAAEQVTEKAPGGARLVLADLPDGHFWIASSAFARSTPSGAAYALEISLPLMVPWSEWPFGDSPEAARASRTRAWLEYGGARWMIHAAGTERDDAGELLRFSFRKRLAADSQPFDLVAQRDYRWSDLPWPVLLPWVLLWTGAVAGLAHVVRQREARRRAEELLRLGQVSRLNALGELAAGLAHELNQPLTAVLAGTQAAARLLDEEPPEMDAARTAMRQATTQARRAADVVARLRRVIDRPDTGERTAVDLTAAARNVLHLLEPESDKRGVAVRLEAGDAAPAWADPVAVDQILHNLIGNALHALAVVATPELVISTANAGPGMVRLTVRDNGPGVPPELAGRLFEPFVSGRPGGLGLGLSLCQTLAEEMGGRLRYRAASPGAEFILELPSAQSAPGPQEGREGRTP